jgi:hypothetical protein
MILPIWSSGTTSGKRSARSWATDAQLIRGRARLFIGPASFVFYLCAASGSVIF